MDHGPYLLNNKKFPSQNFLFDESSVKHEYKQRGEILTEYTSFVESLNTKYPFLLLGF